MRGRNRNNKGPNPLTRSYESNGPDVKIRGTAQHIAEKYAQLARDSQASGDPVAAENYFQHAEHYYRIIAAAQEQLREQFGYQQRFDDEGDEEGGFLPNDRFGEDSDPSSQPQPFETRQERPERQDAERQPRFDRGDRPERQERGDRRERFQRDRGPRQDFQRQDTQRQDTQRQDTQRQDTQRQDTQRQDFQRGEGEFRSDRPERQERPERPERGEFRRDRRRDENEGEAANLPAFLTTPVRQPIAITSDEGEPAPPAENGAADEANGDYRTRRRRRRTRFPSDEGGAEFAPEVVDTPAAE
jgi:hypothetical protein